MVIEIAGQHLSLSEERALFWEECRTLILSDLHIGKGGHFRKAGIPIPGQVQDHDLGRLDSLVGQKGAERIIVVGDMFHSEANRELDKFNAWREAHADLEVILVKGNHDILKKDYYRENCIEVVQDGYRLENFIFSHAPSSGPVDSYTFSGHLHPGILVRGGGRQKLRLPCFWFTAHYVVMPAFSLFTGLSLIQPGSGERVVGIADGQLIELK